MAQLMVGRNAQGVQKHIRTDDEGRIEVVGGGGGTGATASEIDTALKATAQPITAVAPIPISASAPVPISATGIAKDSQLPATLGAKTTAQSLSIVAASDSEGIGTKARPAYVQFEQLNPAISLTIRTAAYVANRVLADTQALPGAVWEDGGTGKITGITLTDPSNQSAPMTLVFFAANAAVGAENAAPSLSAADSMSYLGHVDVTASHYKSIGGIAVATVPCRVSVRAAAGSRSIYVAAINGTGTPTYAGGVIQLRCMIEPAATDLSAPTPVLVGAEVLPILEAANWTVAGTDATHIATFNSGTLRYQSDTTSPQLTLTRSGAVTTGTQYLVEIEVSAWTSGSVKISWATDLVANGPGKFSATMTPNNTNVVLTRGSANVDMTISRISIRPVL